MKQQPELSSSERKLYRGMAMTQKPAIVIGKAGVTASLIGEADRAFDRSKVIKVRFTSTDREQRKALLNELAAACGAAICGESGHTASLFRPAVDTPASADS